MKNNYKDIIRYICYNALFIALYVALTALTGDISFGYSGIISFRIAEILLAILLFDKRFLIGAIISCLLANLLFGNPLDVLVGTIQTAISASLLILIKNKHLAIISSSAICGIMIGFELIYLGFSSIGYYIILTIFVSELLMLYLGFFFFKKIKKFFK